MPVMRVTCIALHVSSWWWAVFLSTLCHVCDWISAVVVQNIEDYPAFYLVVKSSVILYLSSSEITPYCSQYFYIAATDIALSVWINLLALCLLRLYHLCCSLTGFVEWLVPVRSALKAYKWLTFQLGFNHVVLLLLFHGLWWFHIRYAFSVSAHMLALTCQSEVIWCKWDFGIAISHVFRIVGV